MSAFTAEPLWASGLSSERLNLPALQSKMKCDPEGYKAELHLLYSQFNSSLDLFKQQSDLGFSSLGGIASDPTVAKELGERAMFLSHVTPFYRDELADFPGKVKGLLESCAQSLPSGLRCTLVQALILLINRQIVDIGDTLALFMELQTLGDRSLRKLASSHVINSIKRMNKKHKNEAKNRALQNILFSMLQQDDEAKAKRSLSTLCELHRRKVWFDERTANAICMAGFHPSSRIMIAALSFLIDYEKLEDDDDSDASSSEDEKTPQNPHVILNKEAIYKANHKGTTASKRKKKAKLQRAMRSMKRQQRMSSENTNTYYYSPLNHLKDAQGFAEKLFSRLQTCNERFEVKMMMLKVISRTIGLHRLILLNFYPFVMKYAQPHQRDITNLLAAAVQACHDMVPPDAVEPLFKQIVNQFVHDRSRPEAIAVGLNVVREICLRMPLLMTEELLQDLALYKKSHEKAVSAASRSLIMLFREVCPSLLVKKDRGRPTDPKARPKAYGEVNVASHVPGAELLKNDLEDDDNSNDYEEVDSDDDGSISDQSLGGSSDHNDDDKASSSNEEDDQLCSGDSDSEENEVQEDEMASDDGQINDSLNDDEEDSDDEDNSGNDDTEDENDDTEDDNDGAEIALREADEDSTKDTKEKKRKFADFDGQLMAAETSLRALKRLAGEKMKQPSELPDGILSNEDFQRIKELKAEKEAKAALSQHGLLRNCDQLTAKPVNPDKFDAKIRRKPTKEEKLAAIRAGREERGKYQARAAVKQKKTGGLSNQQKEHKKAMPLAAKREKIAKTRQQKKRKQQRAGKQFRGRKAWK